MNITFKSLFFVFVFSIAYAQNGYSEINDKWGDGVPNYIDFSKGDYLESPSKEYRLMRTEDKKNMAVHEQDDSGNWVHHGGIWSTTRPNDHFHFDVKSLEINSFQVVMKSGGLTPFGLWHQSFFIEGNIEGVLMVGLSYMFEGSFFFGFHSNSPLVIPRYYHKLSLNDDGDLSIDLIFPTNLLLLEEYRNLWTSNEGFHRRLIYESLVEYLNNEYSVSNSISTGESIPSELKPVIMSEDNSKILIGGRYLYNTRDLVPIHFNEGEEVIVEPILDLSEVK